MNKETINIYYDGIIDRAEEMNELAEKLFLMVNDNIGDCTNTVRRSWTGDSGELYAQKVNDTACRLRQRARDLQNVSVSLKESAERMRKADLLAISILGG
jgi:uncharacterized protein YukE